MALIDKASLLMVPSTYEAGKLYNVLPSGNRAPDNKGGAGYDQTRADFTFDRGTDHAATRIGSDGLIKKYRENLFKYSNQFDNAIWDGPSTWTSGQADKDGGTDAWNFAKSGVSSSDYYNDTTINGVQTFSIYVKKQEGVGIKPYFFGSSNGFATFDLEDGSVYNTGGSIIIDTNVEAYNFEWWRISVSINGSSGNWYLYATDGTDTQTTDVITLQNAQLESGLVATDYLESTSVTGKAGVLVDLPRINYDANGENGSLLLEPSRKNSVQYSEWGDNWTTQGVSITNNQTISPENYTNAVEFLESATTGNHGFYSQISLSSNTYYAASVFVKKLGRRYIGLQSWWSSTKGAIAYFDLDNVESKGTYAHGTNYSASDAKIESYGNDWYRISAVFQSGETNQYYGVVSMDSLWTTGTSYTNNYTGDNSKGFYAYGLQVEAGSYSTSYIPNHGESGGVTRAGDYCYKSGLGDVIGQTEGTLFFDWVMNHESPNTSEDLYTLSVTDGSGNKMMGVNNYNQTIAVFIKNTTTQFFDNSYTGGADGARIKLGLAYANNDIALYINGAQIATDSSATIPTLNQIRLNTFWNGNLPDSSSVKQLALFKERLSNAELATLTTL